MGTRRGSAETEEEEECGSGEGGEKFCSECVEMVRKEEGLSESELI